MLRSPSEVLSLIVWSQDGDPCFRLRVGDAGMRLDDAAETLARHIEERLASDHELFDGADATLRVALHSDGRWADGRGWLDAPDDHEPTPLQTLARAAVTFLRSGTSTE